MLNPLSTISSIAVGLAAVAGAVIAALGLGTWREQLKGTSEYEAARDALLRVYKLRDSLEYVRQPFLMVSEASSGDDAQPWEVSAYQNRWKHVRDAMIELDAALLECEVLWGKSVKPHSARLVKLVNRLNRAVGMYIQSKLDPAFADDFTKELRDTLYSGSGKDEYNTELALCVNEFEQFVRPHLRQKLK